MRTEPDPIADQFIAALGALESNADFEPMTALFSEDCAVGNVMTAEAFQGPDGARRFWTNYRDHFGEVTSSFRNQIVAESKLALEWTTEGTSKSGGPIHYEGVSILETDGGRITRFFAYFNPNHFHPVISQEMEKGYGG